jgi:hypothetical protein
LRRECLDHLILLDEQHLRSALTEFVRYYNQERPHRTLGLQTPPVDGASDDRNCPLAASVERTTPRLRTSRLTIAEVLPPHTLTTAAVSKLLADERAPGDALKRAGLKLPQTTDWTRSEAGRLGRVAAGAFGRRQKLLV